MLRRFAGERGMALPLALGVMLVLTISVFSVLAFTGANARESTVTKARQNAKALAESGFNRAASVLWKNYNDNQTTTALPVCSASCVSGIPSGQTVTWSTVLESGSGDDRIWKVTAVGTVPNPSGPGAGPVRRTVSGKFKLGAQPSLSAWKGVYAADQGSDCFMQNHVVVKTPVYIRQGPSNINTPVCIKDQLTRYMGSDFRIKGRFQSDHPEATVGTGAATPDYPTPFTVPSVHIANQCSPWSGSGPGVVGTPCTSSHNVFRCSPASASCYSNVVEDIVKPQYDFALARTAAKPGPLRFCDPGPNNPPADFFTTTGEIEIMGPTAYNCEVWVSGELVGKLQWTPGTFNASNLNGTHGTLVAKGLIYFTGKLKFDKVYGRVDVPTGTTPAPQIYVYDSILMPGDPGGLCGSVDTAPGTPLCDFSTSGPNAWDPGVTEDIIFFFTGQLAPGSTSMDVGNYFELQASVYTVGKFILQGHAKFKGPLITQQMELKNEAYVEGWTPLNSVPPPPGSILGLQLVSQSWSG